MTTATLTPATEYKFADDLAAAQAAHAANPYKHLDCYQQRAMQTRNARAEVNARNLRCKKALQLYFIDNAKARKEGGATPSLAAYQVRDGNTYDASEYSLSRFNELGRNGEKR